MNGNLIYAIGDVHGHLDKLQDLHKLIASDADHLAHQIIHVGDLCDRGPDSRGVIEYLMEGQAAGKDWHVIKGNHDRYLQNFAQSGQLFDPYGATGLDWLNPRLGGDKTLLSFGIDPENNPIGRRDNIPAEITTWIENLPLMMRVGDFCFVHAGVRPNIALDQQIEQDLIWIREPFLSSNDELGAIIVHGHTMIDEITHHGNRINIDTGAGRGDALSAIIIDVDEVFVLGDERRLISPPEGWDNFGKKFA